MICATCSRPYLPRHVLDHFAAPVHAEVDVDIGHRHALGIQEALEQQHILHRIDVRDLHAVGHQRAGRRPAPRAHRDALLPRVADKVPHDQEVARKLHLLDDVDFAVQPRLDIPESSCCSRPRDSQLRAPPSPAASATPRGTPARSSCRACGPREPRTPETDCPPSCSLRVAALANSIVRAAPPAEHAERAAPSRRRTSCRTGRESNLKRLGSFIDPPSARRASRRAHASHRPRKVVPVVGRDQRNVQFLLEPEQIRLDLLLLLQPLVLDLEKEVPLPKMSSILPGRWLGLFVLALPSVPGTTLPPGSRKSRSAPWYVGEKFLAHARLAIEAVQRWPRW